MRARFCASGLQFGTAGEDEDQVGTKRAESRPNPALESRAISQKQDDRSDAPSHAQHGERGAEALASVLTIHSRDVRVITPPVGLKDARAWKLAGASAADVQGAADGAPRQEVKVISKGADCGV